MVLKVLLWIDIFQWFPVDILSTSLKQKGCSILCYFTDIFSWVWLWLCRNEWSCWYYKWGKHTFLAEVFHQSYWGTDVTNNHPGGSLHLNINSKWPPKCFFSHKIQSLKLRKFLYPLWWVLLPSSLLCAVARWTFYLVGTSNTFTSFQSFEIKGFLSAIIN